MRNRKFVKPLLVVVAMVLVCIMTVFVTLAYLTSTTEKVTNTFTVGNVTITLDEAKVDEYGVKEYKVGQDGQLTQELAARVMANSYKLVPQHEYVKDPTIHVDGASENCYVRAYITVTKAAALKALGCTADCDNAADGEGVDDTKNFIEVFGVVLGENWSVFDCKEEGDSFVFEVRNSEVVSASDDVVIFSKFTTPDIDGTQLATINGMSIDVIAEAIQADTFTTATAAFDSLDAQKAAA